MTDLLSCSDIKSLVIIGLASLVAKEDYQKYRISNLSVLVTLGIGLFWITCNLRLQGLALGMTGSLVGFSLLIPFYALGGLTAGDVKWLAALGAWYGPKGIVGLFLVSGISLGAMSLYWIFRNQTTRICQISIDEIYASNLRNQRLIPYGVAVAISVIGIELIRIAIG